MNSTGSRLGTSAASAITGWRDDTITTPTPSTIAMIRLRLSWRMMSGISIAERMG